MKINLQITSADGVTREVPTICRIDTENEIAYYRNVGSCRTCCGNWRLARAAR